MRLSAQRSVGGMAIVVITAMATIIVNRSWLSAPIDNPTVAMITSVEPRAFMPQASARPSRRVSPPSSAPMNAPPNLPMLATSTRPTVNSAIVGSARMVRSAVNPAMPKNTGAKNAVISPRNCSSMWRVRIGDSPTRMPATKAPSTVCTPIRCVISAITPMMHRMAVITANSLTR